MTLGRQYLDLSNIYMNDRLYHHFQGCCAVDGRLVFSRSGKDNGVLIYEDAVAKGLNRGKKKSDTVPNVPYLKNVPESHVGGMDSATNKVAVACYDPKDEQGVIRVYEDSLLTFVSPTKRRAYSVGIENTGRREYLFAVQESAEGRRVSFYRWYVRAGESIPLRWLSTVRMDSRHCSKNNMVLRKEPDGLFLYCLRAHFGYGEVTQYPVIEKETEVDVLQPRKRYRYRNGLCSARFASTLLFEKKDVFLLRSERNVVRGKLRYRMDRVNWTEV